MCAVHLIWLNFVLSDFNSIFQILVADDEPVEVIRRRTLGTAAVTFLAVFVFAVLVIAVLLFIVFTKLRQHHKNIPSSSSGSSSTSESTLRSTGTSSPLEDETFSNQPSKTYRNQRTKKGDRRRSKEIVTQKKDAKDRIPLWCRSCTKMYLWRNFRTRLGHRK